MAVSLSDRPLFLVATSSLGFAAQGLLVKLLSETGLYSFQAVLVRGLFQGLGVAVVLLTWGTPIKTWLGVNRDEACCLFLRGFFG
jgi:hypothetical protein